ncbi:MAG: helix-turn-helix domain-containing protein [Rickettsiales bacterium]|nr:helix-turn-helix domain-containing protein [Rickettsiales bacterium]
MPSHPVDKHVGSRLRTRRTILGMSQEALGDAVGITFQQIQKYEKGLNRIGSSRLYEFACILNVDVSYFFEDIASGDDSISVANESYDEFKYDSLGNKEILTLVRAYNNIADAVVRKRILTLMKSLSSVAEDRTSDNDDVDSAEDESLVNRSFAQEDA